MSADLVMGFYARDDPGIWEGELTCGAANDSLDGRRLSTVVMLFAKAILIGEAGC